MAAARKSETEKAPHDAHEEKAVADAPMPSVAPPAEDLGKCANCDRPAIVKTNFSFATHTPYCGTCLPDNYRYLLGG